MDTPGRLPASPVVPGDDPWAGPVVPEPAPLATDVVLPVMPWDVPEAPMALPRPATPLPDRGPEPVPTTRTSQ